MSAHMQSHSPLPRGQPLVGVLQPFLAAASAAGGSGGSPQPTLGSGGGGQDLARPTAQFPSFTGGPRCVHAVNCSTYAFGL